MPHNPELEREVLGAVMMAEGLGDAATLTPEDFYLDAHAALWTTFVAMTTRGEPLQFGVVHEALRAADQLRVVGDLDGLNRLADHGSASAIYQLAWHAATLRGLTRERRVLAVAHAILDRSGAEGDLVDFAEAEMLRATARDDGRGIQGPRPIVKRFFQNIGRRAKGEEPAVETPWHPLNELLRNGLRPGNMVVVAGRPSMGKTTVALNMATHAAVPRSSEMDGERSCRVKEPVLIFSLEMTADELADRIFAAEAPVDMDVIRRPVRKEGERLVGILQVDEHQALNRTAIRVLAGSIYINDSAAPTVVEIASAVRRWRADRSVFTDPAQLGLVIVDHIGLVPPLAGPKGRTREAEVSEISRALKRLALDVKIPIIVVSQLNRGVESRQDKRPMLSDLRESGAIEQDADVVMLMFRPEYYLGPDADEATRAKVKGLAECIVAKQRNGATDTVRLLFRKAVNKFETLERNA